MRKPGEPEDADEHAPPGGRAMERLMQFEQERGFDVSEDVSEDVGEDIGEEEPESSDDEAPEEPATEDETDT